MLKVVAILVIGAVSSLLAASSLGGTRTDWSGWPVRAPPPRITVDFHLWGTRYLTAPNYKVTADHVVVASGTVEALSPDSAELVHVELPNGGNPTSIQLYLTNDSYAGEGKDTNLCLKAVEVNGHPIDLTTVDLTGDKYLYRLGDGSISIATDFQPFDFRRPDAGWAVP
jgi:hypothetical protein